jgi:hypothetical protein
MARLFPENQALIIQGGWESGSMSSPDVRPVLYPIIARATCETIIY